MQYENLNFDDRISISLFPASIWTFSAADNSFKPFLMSQHDEALHLSLSYVAMSDIYGVVFNVTKITQDFNDSGR